MSRDDLHLHVEHALAGRRCGTGSASLFQRRQGGSRSSASKSLSRPVAEVDLVERVLDSDLEPSPRRRSRRPSPACARAGSNGWHRCAPAPSARPAAAPARGRRHRGGCRSCGRRESRRHCRGPHGGRGRSSCSRRYCRRGCSSSPAMKASVRCPRLRVGELLGRRLHEVARRRRRAPRRCPGRARAWRSARRR